MLKKDLLRRIAICSLATMMMVQTPVSVSADEGTTAENFEFIEETGEPDELPDSGSEPEVTPEPDGTKEAEGQESDPTDPLPEENVEEEKKEEEKKEVLPINAAITVSGDAGDLTLVLTVTNASFVTENPPDFKTAFAEVPEGVTIDVVAQTENTITYHIYGKVVNYTKSDLVMTVPANWLKNTADEIVDTETKLDEHDLYWCAHADFGIRLKSKAETVDNETFIAQQNLKENQVDYDTLRFVHKDLELQCFTGKTKIFEYPAEDARIVGKASKNQAVYKIITIQDGWVYVESGNVRGFVKEEKITLPEENQIIYRCNTARVTIPWHENKAFDYVRITGYNAQLKEIPRITLKDVEIKEEKNKESKTVGTITENGIVYWLSSELNGWVYVESNDVRGFVKEKDLVSAKESALLVKENGKEAYASAEESVKPEENKAFYYKLVSAKAGDLEAFYREQIVELAKTYLGNPYVYGGTDPVNGIDCSAFMQYLYGIYGISLPRTSKSQGFVGTMITKDSVDKGDLIIYADDAEIYHVVMFAGDGKTVEAANEAEGIVSKEVNATNAVWGISLLDGVELEKLPAMINKPSYSYETQEAYKERIREENE